jgi:hypothetical protein
MKSKVAIQLERSRIIPSTMKGKIQKYINSSSRYHNGLILGLRKPPSMGKISKKISGVSFGADKNGFFVYTQRARSKSHPDPLRITKCEIDFVESTG